MAALISYKKCFMPSELT